MWFVAGGRPGRYRPGMAGSDRPVAGPGRLGPVTRSALGRPGRRVRRPGRDPPGRAGLARHPVGHGRRVGDALAGARPLPRRWGGGDRLRHLASRCDAHDHGGWRRPRMARRAARRSGARPHGRPRHPGGRDAAQGARAPPMERRPGAAVPLGPPRGGDRGGHDRRARAPGRARGGTRPRGRRRPRRRLRAGHRRGAPGGDGALADRRRGRRHHRAGGDPRRGVGDHGVVPTGSSPGVLRRLVEIDDAPVPGAGQSRS
jgi:hypothetical protein